MRTLRGQPAALGVVAVLASVAITPPAAAVDGIPARIVVADRPVSVGNYPTVDYGRSDSPGDDRHATTTWRVVQGTGNCCENYLTTTPDGRLLDFGGTHITYSDDRGRSWRQVQPLTPMVNGEGAIVAAPGGDVLGVEWDPYSGDHLQAYKYEADTGQWLYTEMVLHQPFYDREWIGVVPGPVTIDGNTYDYVSFVKGGYPSKEIWLMSTDGLNYTDVSSKFVDQITSGKTLTGPLPARAETANDWIQPNTGSKMTTLGTSSMLAAPDAGSQWALYDGNGWSAYRYPDGTQPSGLLQVDSAGSVHNVVPTSGGDGFDYRTSTDGGHTWHTTTVTLPPRHTIEEIDFRAHAAAGVGAVAVRAQGPTADRDLVYKLDITRAQPRLTRAYQVGLGDVDATGGVGNDVRFDFASVAIFDDGRVAVSFLDSTTTSPSTTNPDRKSPAVAIEGATTLGAKLKPEPEITPELGTPYAAFDFESGNQNWTTGGTPTWTRSAPGAGTDGTDDPNGTAFAMAGPTQYVDNADATLESPPITAPAGPAVLEFQLKTDTEQGFDTVSAQWSADGTTWEPIGAFSGRNTGYPSWQQVTLGFTSPAGQIRVRFQFTSDLVCSALTPACGEFTGVHVDNVIVGSQATKN